MLPGLIYTRLPDLYQCKTVQTISTEAIKGELKEFDEYENLCSSECKSFHLYYYISFVNEGRRSISNRTFLKGCLRNECHIVRLAALKNVIKYGNDGDGFLMKMAIVFLTDPFYKVRYAFLKYIDKMDGPFDDNLVYTVCEMMDDDNDCIRIRSIIFLQNKCTHDENVSKRVRKRVRRLVFDRNETVRRKFLRLLGSVSHNNVGVLIDKRMGGAFVYGLEDECCRVRKEAVRLLYKMFDVSTLENAYELLVDALNDDDGTVRYFTSVVLVKLGKKFSWEIPKPYLDMLILSLRDSDRRVSENVFKFIGCLKYNINTVFILNYLIDNAKNSTRTQLIYRTILRIVPRNIDLISSNVDNLCPIKSLGVFDELPTDSTHIAQLFVLKGLSDSRIEIRLSNHVISQLNILKSKSTGKKSSLQGFNDRGYKKLKSKFLDMLNCIMKNGAQIERYNGSFVKKHMTSDYKLYFKELYDSVCRLIRNGNVDGFNSVMARFSLHDYTIQIPSLSDVHSTVSSISTDQLRRIYFTVLVPKKVWVYKSDPIRFRIEFISNIYKNLFFSVMDCATHLSLLYEANKDTFICLGDLSTKMLGIVVVAGNDQKIPISEVYSVSIHRIT